MHEHERSASQAHTRVRTTTTSDSYCISSSSISNNNDNGKTTIAWCTHSPIIIGFPIFHQDQEDQSPLVAEFAIKTACQLPSRPLYQANATYFSYSCQAMLFASFPRTPAVITASIQALLHSAQHAACRHPNLTFAYRSDKPFISKIP
jgi:NAD-dependent oxidoreductase involved in siderophore biosynthesis